MIMIGNETDLHYKVVDMIRRFYPDSILAAGLGENQDTEDKRLDSYRKGYMKGQPDLMILSYHKDFIGLGIEFKSPTGNNNNTLYLKRVARIVTETSKLVRPNPKYLADARSRPSINSLNYYTILINARRHKLMNPIYYDPHKPPQTGLPSYPTILLTILQYHFHPPTVLNKSKCSHNGDNSHSSLCSCVINSRLYISLYFCDSNN